MRHPKLPTIKIKGKEYTEVDERVLYFNDTYPDGSIETFIMSAPDANRVVVQATVTPDIINAPGRRFTGTSQAVIGDGAINKSAALENAETSAVGRALGMMGIGVVGSIASADEIKKATGFQATDADVPDFYPAENSRVLTAEPPHPQVQGMMDDQAESEKSEQFVPLTQERNKEIQDRLQELTKKTINRRKLSLFLEHEHGGKKSFDVPATQWETTIGKIETAVAGGEDAIKQLLKVE